MTFLALRLRQDTPHTCWRLFPPPCPCDISWLIRSRLQRLLGQLLSRANSVLAHDPPPPLALRGHTGRQHPPDTELEYRLALPWSSWRRNPGFEKAPPPFRLQTPAPPGQAGKAPSGSQRQIP